MRWRLRLREQALSKDVEQVRSRAEISSQFCGAPSLLGATAPPARQCDAELGMCVWVQSHRFVSEKSVPNVDDIKEVLP